MANNSMINLVNVVNNSMNSDLTNSSRKKLLGVVELSIPESPAEVGTQTLIVERVISLIDPTTFLSIYPLPTQTNVAPLQSSVASSVPDGIASTDNGIHQSVVVENEESTVRIPENSHDSSSSTSSSSDDDSDDSGEIDDDDKPINSHVINQENQPAQGSDNRVTNDEMSNDSEKISILIKNGAVYRKMTSTQTRSSGKCYQTMLKYKEEEERQEKQRQEEEKKAKEELKLKRQRESEEKKEARKKRKFEQEQKLLEKEKRKQQKQQKNVEKLQKDETSAKLSQSSKETVVQKKNEESFMKNVSKQRQLARIQQQHEALPKLKIPKIKKIEKVHFPQFSAHGESYNQQVLSQSNVNDANIHQPHLVSDNDNLAAQKKCKDQPSTRRLQLKQKVKSKKNVQSHSHSATNCDISDDSGVSLASTSSESIVSQPLSRSVAEDDEMNALNQSNFAFKQSVEACMINNFDSNANFPHDSNEVQRALDTLIRETVQENCDFNPSFINTSQVDFDGILSYLNQ